MAQEAVIETWNKVKCEVMEYLKDKEFLSLLAHGSYAEGVANKNSDFDLLVVCAGDIKRSENVVVVNDLEINIEYIGKDILLNQLKSLENLIAPKTIGFGIPLACRLKNAVVLIDKDDVGKTLVEMARSYQPSADLMNQYSKNVLNYYYDAVGAMASGDYATSVLMSRIAALHVLTGILLNQGELYVMKKWFIHLLERVPSAPKEPFLRLMNLDDVDKEKAQQCVRDLNSLISEFQRLREESR